MIVVDANLLIYAYDISCPDHAKARAWIESAFSGDEDIGLPWQSVAAFLRVLTYPSTQGERLTMPQALAVVDEWMKLPNVRMLSAGDRHWSFFRDMLLNGSVRGKLTSDAVIAALALEHGGVVYSNDRDFARFSGLRWVNPLQKP
jgi:toxin-antitoxin system PIN domain toxin